MLFYSVLYRLCSHQYCIDTSCFCTVSILLSSVLYRYCSLLNCIDIVVIVLLYSYYLKTSCSILLYSVLPWYCSLQKSLDTVFSYFLDTLFLYIDLIVFFSSVLPRYCSSLYYLDTFFYSLLCFFGFCKSHYPDWFKFCLYFILFCYSMAAISIVVCDFNDTLR
jgi:hypothetical protein